MHGEGRDLWLQEGGSATKVVVDTGVELWEAVATLGRAPHAPHEDAQAGTLWDACTSGDPWPFSHNM